MADRTDFLHQSYSFLYNVLLETVIAVIVLGIATLLTKMFKSQEDGHKMGPDDTNYCSSSECLRCSRDYCDDSDEAATEVLSKELEDFSSLRGDRTGLERLYQGIERYKTQGRQSDSLASQKPTVFYVHGLSCKPWYSEYAKKLRSLVLPKNFDLIKSEFKWIRLNKTKGWFKNTTPEGEWLVFHLFNQGKKVECNCAMCPNTVQLIESVESFMKGSSFGNALFSVVTPGTHITSHYGPTNCRMRCHLPLFVPEGCFLCVNGEERQWKERELLLFDDSFLHEAWHRGMDGERVVLMLDLWHPELTVVEKAALSFIFPWNTM